MAQRTAHISGKSAAKPKPSRSRTNAAVLPNDSKLGDHEEWLQHNAEARALLERGLTDLAEGRVHTGLSFVQYADDLIEE